MPVESQIQSAVIAFAREHGWLVRRLQYTGRVGAPDVVAFRDGVVRLVEFKRPGGKLSPGQASEHKLLAQHGIHVPVIDDIEDGYKLFR
jgi:hypothetical protein